MKKCSVCGSEYRVCNTPIGHLCNKHYQQYSRYGKILKRTTKDPNEIIINGDGTATVILYNKNREAVAKTIVDECDLERVSAHKWRMDCYGYAVTRNDKLGLCNYRLHRMLLGDPKGYEVDHIDGDKLNNRRSNLRIVTSQQNAMNRRMSRVSSSGYVGVHASRSISNPWEARIRKNGKIYHLGLFKTKEDAAKAREVAELRMFGEYSPLNRPQKQSKEI